MSKSDGCSFNTRFLPVSVSSHYAGLTVPTLPGTLASLTLPAAARLGFPAIPAGHSVLLVSNLNPEVSRPLPPSRPEVKL